MKWWLSLQSVSIIKVDKIYLYAGRIKILKSYMEYLWNYKTGPESYIRKIILSLS